MMQPPQYNHQSLPNSHALLDWSNPLVERTNVMNRKTNKATNYNPREQPELSRTEIDWGDEKRRAQPSALRNKNR